jgi:hypothetical protein
MFLSVWNFYLYMYSCLPLVGPKLAIRYSYSYFLIVCCFSYNNWNYSLYSSFSYNINCLHCIAYHDIKGRKTLVLFYNKCMILEWQIKIFHFLVYIALNCMLWGLDKKSLKISRYLRFYYRSSSTWYKRLLRWTGRYNNIR